MRRVDVTARRVFQERWLRDNGKVQVIEHAAAPDRALAPGLSGALGRAVYSGIYCVGFGAALPLYVAGAVVGPMGGALARGLREGAAAAAKSATRSHSNGQAAATGARCRVEHAARRAGRLTPENRKHPPQKPSSASTPPNLSPLPLLTRPQPPLPPPPPAALTQRLNR